MLRRLLKIKGPNNLGPGIFKILPIFNPRGTIINSIYGSDGTTLLLLNITKGSATVTEVSENANLLHGKDYSIHVSQKLSVKVDTNLVKEKLGELEYHKCKVPTQYKQIQALPIEEATVRRNKKATIEEVADFRITA